MRLRYGLVKYEQLSVVRCAAGLADAGPGLRYRILLNYTRIENAHKVRNTTLDFCDV